MNSFDGCVSYFTLVREFRKEGRHSTRRCPLWVKSRHLQCQTACPLLPLIATSIASFGMSALGHKRTFCFY